MDVDSEPNSSLCLHDITQRRKNNWRNPGRNINRNHCRNTKRNHCEEAHLCFRVYFFFYVSFMLWKGSKLWCKEQNNLSSIHFHHGKKLNRGNNFTPFVFSNWANPQQIILQFLIIRAGEISLGKTNVIISRRKKFTTANQNYSSGALYLPPHHFWFKVSFFFFNVTRVLKIASTVSVPLKYALQNICICIA